MWWQQAMEDVGHLSPLKMSSFSPSNNSPTSQSIVDPLLSRFSAAAAHRNNMVSFAAAAALAKANFIDRNSTNMIDRSSTKLFDKVLTERDEDEEDEESIIDVGKISPKREIVEELSLNLGESEEESFVRVSGADSSSEKQNMVSEI
jgi:hypothetical protein